ncbi:unnamed protein product [Prunus armeniaca]
MYLAVGAGDKYGHLEQLASMGSWSSWEQLRELLGIESTTAEVDPKDQTLADRLRQLSAESVISDLDVEPVPKLGRHTEASRVVFATEEDDGPVEPINIACPPKTVQSEIKELLNRLLREEPGCAFHLQASASMDMWLCVKRAISATERAKKAYEDGCAKVAKLGKALQDHAHLLKEKQATERQVKASEAKLAEMRAALDAAVTAAKDVEAAKEAMQVALEDSERAKAVEIKAAVREVIRGYRSSDKFTALLDNEVGSEMADLLYRFKRFNPGQKLNLSFATDPPPLSEGVTEEMIEDYEGEDAPEDVTAIESPAVAAATEGAEAADEGDTV